jgi:bifunctional enzyme CysN/CysC
MVVAVNKMDLAAFDERRFEEVRRDFIDFCTRLEVTDVEFIPISASNGDNVVERSAAMPWYRGRPLLDYLENVHVASDRNLIDLRFPVQLTLRSGDTRHLAGTIASGVIRTGDEVVVFPSLRRAHIASLAAGGEGVAEAFAPMAVTATLDRDVDVSRGDLIAHVRNVPTLERELEAMVVWMDESPLAAGREYLLKHATASIPCKVSDVRYRVDVQELRHHAAAQLALNEIGRVRLATARPIAFDSYARNRAMGSFILIDRLTNATAGAGMILDREAADRAQPEPRKVRRADASRVLRWSGTTSPAPAAETRSPSGGAREKRTS